MAAHPAADLENPRATAPAAPDWSIIHETHIETPTAHGHIDLANGVGILRKRMSVALSIPSDAENATSPAKRAAATAGRPAPAPTAMAEAGSTATQAAASAVAARAHPPGTAPHAPPCDG